MRLFAVEEVPLVVTTRSALEVVAEDRGQRAEVGGQKSEVRGQRAEIRLRETSVNWGSGCAA
jgi:hypothetical protein